MDLVKVKLVVAKMKKEQLSELPETEAILAFQLIFWRGAYLGAGPSPGAGNL